MLAQGFLDLFFDAAPHLEYSLQYFELSTKAAFAKAAFDTLQDKFTQISIPCDQIQNRLKFPEIAQIS